MTIIEAIIEAENVDFSYDKIPVLKDVSFSISEKESIAIFGPNGGGKTTLLHLIMGFILPTKGKIKVFGLSPKEARKFIGWVPQSFHYDHAFPISVFEVVLMGRLAKTSFFGGYTKEDENAAMLALEKVDMAKFKNSPFSDLSGGEAQRVLIARALVREPKLLLLDEPTSSVDVKAEEKIYSFLDTLKKDMTILMVTHDLKIATTNVDRVFCVQSTLTPILPKELCEHFAVGLYHPPIKVKS